MASEPREKRRVTMGPGDLMPVAGAPDESAIRRSRAYAMNVRAIVLAKKAWALALKAGFEPDDVRRLAADDVLRAAGGARSGE